jgi:hypothetical protein
LVSRILADREENPVGERTMSLELLHYVAIIPDGEENPFAGASPGKNQTKGLLN